MRMIRKMAGVIDEQTEAVEALNTKLDNINIEGLDVEVAKNTGDIKQLKISDAEHTEQIATIDTNIDNHAREITALKTKDATHDTEIAELDKVTDALTKEIPNGITLYRDGTGKIKAVISQEDDTTIDSNVLDMIIPYQYDIISGTTSRSFKLDITMSDGTKYTTNDFVIPAGGGTSVSITAITLTKNADNPNKFKVSVKLDDGSTIESGEIEMVTSVSGTFANNKLTITVNGVSSTPITIDTTGTTYTAGTGIKIASGVISIDDTKVALKSDISDMETKTHANATFATKTALTTLQNATKVAVSEFAITESADKVTITTTAIDGATSKSEDIPAVTDTVAGIVTPALKKKWDSSGSGEWEDIDTSNIPTDWVAGTEIEGYINCDIAGITPVPDKWTSPISVTSPHLYTNETASIRMYFKGYIDVNHVFVRITLYTYISKYQGYTITLRDIGNIDTWNNKSSDYLMFIEASLFNGVSSLTVSSLEITRDNAPSALKVLRRKKP